MRTLTVCICTLTLAGLGHAQTTKVVPAAAATSDGSSSTPYFSGYGSGRAQQVILGKKLAPNTALIREVALRADGSNLQTVPGRSFTNLKFYLGVTDKSPSTMSTTFASNRTSVYKLMFSGAMNLPAQNATTRPFNIRWKLSAPYLYRAADGNLLLEWEVPGQPTKSNYFLDTHADSATPGQFKAYGPAGKFAASESYTVTCPNPAGLAPGGKAEFMTASFKKNYPAIVAWGFSDKFYGPLPLPFDLTTLGAPGNALNCSIDLALPLVMQAGRGGWEARSALPIPYHPWFNGFQIFAQAIFVDQPSNALGLVFSQGLQLTVSEDSAGTLLGHYDSTSATGYLTTRQGLVIEFTGVFS